MLERIGEMGELWGEPTMMSIGSDTKPLNLSWTIRSVRKDVRPSSATANVARGPELFQHLFFAVI